MPRAILALLLFVPVLIAAAPLHAQAPRPMVVVGGANTAIPPLSRDEAEQLYLGRTRTLAGDVPVSLADLPAGPARDIFYERLTGKNPSQIRAHWSRMVFTGRALPPREANDVEHLRTLLSADPNLVGYLPAADADERVRILLRLP